MYEFEAYEYEFSKIYKRLLRLELLIKYKLINISLAVYKDEVMQNFSKFFNNKHIYESYSTKKTKENNFLKIRDNKSIDPMLKFEKIINMLTLRHVLHFIFTEEGFRIKEIQDKFYAVKIEKFKELRDSREALIELRNLVAHFNFNNYRTDKNKYLHSLIMYEIVMGCSLGKYQTPCNNLGFKPNMTTIMNKIYELCPELFMKDADNSKFPYNKDRMIVDMYEDIAVLNGWDYSELKSQWDVIRKKYDMNKKRAEEEGLTNLDTEAQISLFDETVWNK